MFLAENLDVTYKPLFRDVSGHAKPNIVEFFGDLRPEILRQNFSAGKMGVYKYS